MHGGGVFQISLLRNAIFKLFKMMYNSVEMISVAVGIINRAFNTNEKAINFFRILIASLIVVGIILGVVGCYFSKLTWLVEVLIVPTLIWVIRGYRATINDNIGLLQGANNTLSGARE